MPDGSWAECKGTLTGKGYRLVCLLGERVMVHRVVLETFVGPCPPGHETAHGDGCRTNNRLDNLRWATPSENSMDQFIHGTHAFGEQIPHAKLTAEKVRQAREMHKSGILTHQLAKRFGVHRHTMYSAIFGKTWKRA